MDQKALFKVSYGMYIVCSKNGDKINGQISNTIFQITSEPPTVAVSINTLNLTHEYIEKSGVFTASVLEKEAPLAFIGKFGFRSGKEINKFDGINFKAGLTGAPVALDYSLAYLELEVVNRAKLGTHTVFFGKLINAEILNSSAEPMTYAYYRDIKQGLSPKTAPTYIAPENYKGTKNTKKYVCKVCGYVYDPANGDPGAGIASGTEFSDLPANWACPTCGADKSQFEELDKPA